MTVTYTLSEAGTFTIHYEATTDRATVTNLSNHMNFNRAGAGSPGGVLRQALMVHADKYLPLDRSQLPLGPLAPVAGTPFDFRTPTAIGTHIHDKNEQLAVAHGYEQIDTADSFDGSYSGIGGRYGKYAAFTLETQHFPDSPNHPDYPTTELKPGQAYSSTTTFRFGVQR